MRASCVSRHVLPSIDRMPPTVSHETSRQPTQPTRAARQEQRRPLVDDIRLLGRILGDVIREQEGEAAFELVERVRQLVGRLPAASATPAPAARSTGC